MDSGTFAKKEWYRELIHNSLVQRWNDKILETLGSAESQKVISNERRNHQMGWFKLDRTNNKKGYLSLKQVLHITIQVM